VECGINYYLIAYEILAALASLATVERIFTGKRIVDKP